MANSNDDIVSTTKFCTRCRINRSISIFRGKRKKMVKDCTVCHSEKDAVHRYEVRTRYRVVKPAQLTMVLFSARGRQKSTLTPPIYGLSTASPSEIIITFSCHAHTVTGN